MSWAKAGRRDHQASPASGARVWLWREPSGAFPLLPWDLSGVDSNASKSHGSGVSLPGLLTFQTKLFVQTHRFPPQTSFSAGCGEGLVKETNMEGVVLLTAKQDKASPPPIRIGVVLVHHL